MPRERLGVTYSLFSGEEMLEHSIQTIRPHVDYINVVIQRKGWFGGEVSPDLDSRLANLVDRGLINRILEYPFNPKKSTNNLTQHVITKKNLGVKDLISEKCTHCLIMDVDELYDSEEFLKARNFVYNNGITHSACPIYDYTISPVYRKRDIAEYSVPFIFALTPESTITNMHLMPCHIDPLRSFSFSRSRHKFWYFNSVTMHHMTGIRSDYATKMENTITNATPAGKVFVQEWWKNHQVLETLPEEELISRGYLRVEDRFNLLRFFPTA